MPRSWNLMRHARWRHTAVHGPASIVVHHIRVIGWHASVPVRTGRAVADKGVCEGGGGGSREQKGLAWCHEPRSGGRVLLVKAPVDRIRTYLAAALRAAAYSRCMLLAGCGLTR